MDVIFAWVLRCPLFCACVECVAVHCVVLLCFYHVFMTLCCGVEHASKLEYCCVLSRQHVTGSAGPCHIIQCHVAGPCPSYVYIYMCICNLCIYIGMHTHIMRVILHALASPPAENIQHNTPSLHIYKDVFMYISIKILSLSLALLW